MIATQSHTGGATSAAPDHAAACGGCPRRAICQNGAASLDAKAGCRPGELFHLIGGRAQPRVVHE